MKRTLLTLILFLTILSISFSQVTKTNKWRKTERDSFENAFLLYEDKLYDLALPVYEITNKNHPNEDFIKYMYGVTSLYRSDKHPDALAYLSEAYDKNKKIDHIEYDLARAYHFNYKFDEALQMVNNHLSRKKLKPEDIAEGELLKKYIENAIRYNGKPTAAKVVNIGPPVNTADEEYVPVISADESMMVFTYAGPKSKGGRQNAFGESTTVGYFGEDAYITYKQNDTFQIPKPLDNLNTNTNDGAISLSPDGQILYLFRDSGDDHGDIYQSFLIGEEFTTPVKLRGQVNSFSWDGHCSLSPDGNTLYFSSERAGGYGGKDIYKATFLPDSTWGNVVNLGDSINTKYDEDSPFIHPDGVTLFYSSKGPKSSGGYDIFMSFMEPDSSFKNTENLGFPINTPDDDIYFVVAANGARGYYSSGRPGGQGLKDIYMVNTEFPNTKLKVFLVKGKVTSEGKPVEAPYTVEVSSKNNSVYKASKSNNVNGSYLSTLPAGQVYKITFNYTSFPAKSYTLDASQITGYTEKIIDVKFDIPKDTTPAIAKVDTFKTKDKVLKNIQESSRKFGNITAEGLEFKVQVAAYKYPKNYTYKHLKGLGTIDKTLVNDKITFITVGPSFKTLGEAWELNKKAVTAGQKDAFVTAIYKGKRVYLEQLEKMGIFK